LSMKHTNPLDSKCLGLHNHGFTTFDCDGQQKKGVGFENKVGPFWTHDASKTSLRSLLRLDVLVSLFFWSLCNGRSCHVCCMLNMFHWTSTSYVA
jgi:hypothetical protein